MISDLPSSHRSWKGCYFFVKGCNWGYDPLDKDDTLGVPVAWTTPENLRECSFYLWYNMFEVVEYFRSCIVLMLPRCSN